MRTLHSYLTRQMLATLGMTVFVFTLVLLLGNVLKEILKLVVNRQASLGLALHAILLLIPYVLAFSLPVGMLTAALLVFGRFSAEQELTAARASGISLISLVTPVLLLSFGVSAVCAWLNMEVAPASRMAYKELLYQSGVRNPADLLQSMESVPFGDETIFVGNRHADGTNFDNIIISQYDTNGRLEELIQSTTGIITSDMIHQKFVIQLHDEHSWRRGKHGWDPLVLGEDAIYTIKFPHSAQTALAVPISDMTFRQLMHQRAEIERRLTEALPAGKDNKQIRDAQREIEAMVKETLAPVLVYMHRAIAFSFACIGFTLVGIPLGIRGHRKETSIGVATALLLMLIYYGFIVLAQAWADHPERAPYLIVWVPNFIFQAVGAVLLWRANRGV